jgi:hypothetical protein
MDRLLAVLPFVVAVACGGGVTNPSTTIGKEVTLRPGATATVADASLKLALDKVQDDSRCAVDVTCVWAGDAVAVVRLIPASGPEETKQLHINGAPERPAQAERGDFVVRFVRLTPAPHSQRPIRPQDYRATFVVDRR